MTDKIIETSIDAPVEQVVEKKLGKRTPLKEQKGIGMAQKPGFIRRLVNKTPGRVEAFLAAGYTPVTDKGQEDNDGRLQIGKSLGENIEVLVNRRPDAPCSHAIWMEIAEEYYNEDQAAKALDNDKTEESYNPKKQAQNNPDLYGAHYSVTTKK